MLQGKFFKKELREIKIYTLEFAKTLDDFDLTKINQPINLKAEQQKDPHIRKVVQ